MSALPRVSAREATRASASVGPRVGLLLVALVQAQTGIWGLLAPHSFFRSFPGVGHHWVVELGPYNEHLVRDYSASELGLAVLLVGAALWFSRRVVLIAGVAFLAATIPHFLYHLTTTEHFSTTDNIASLAGFALELALVAIAMRAVTRRPERSS